ncbi:MAG: nucleotide exchange factor GrpE [Gammaproteobacteria bacterium]|jgi:molecular chaperone GrpE|nr:nucleotide exchange factor GrpE [Gammaproteobacteria bacterium]MBT4462067.1 nucleotide exchange factor GrpE [Gammaproteobacteria bacterium]MBT4654684.1 nucleotide exchange factor GrpE [Gammaproteobacteria bacterium]MBT7931866.1 nucleotide exchange factor GrpE [Gammaproteobacteria bacterium]
MTSTNDEDKKDLETKDTDVAVEEEVELSEIEILQKKHDENYDALLRAKAEVENIKKRSSKEVENAYKYSIESILQEIIPIFDSLSLSCNLSSEKTTKEQLEEGNKLLLNMFKQILEKNNIKEINPEGENFDPELHQAISTIEDKKKKNDDIAEVIQKGYVLNGRVIKPALVIVIKNSN